MQRFEAVTNHLLVIAQGNAEVFMADATLYMEFWHSERRMAVALHGAGGAKSAGPKPSVKTTEYFMSRKFKPCNFYKYELSKIHYLADCLLNTEVLTVVGDSEIII